MHLSHKGGSLNVLSYRVFEESASEVEVLLHNGSHLMLIAKAHGTRHNVHFKCTLEAVIYSDRRMSFIASISTICSSIRLLEQRYVYNWMMVFLALYPVHCSILINIIFLSYQPTCLWAGVYHVILRLQVLSLSSTLIPPYFFPAHVKTRFFFLTIFSA
jgi:hypothetical protein